MTFKIAPHLAAAAFAMSLSPVNAQTSGPVTNFSNEPVILAQASNTAGNGKMAKDKFNKQTALQVTSSVPLLNNIEYAALLNNITPSLAKVLNPLTGKVLLPFRHAGQNGPFLITGQVPPGTINGKTFERDFMQFYHDTNGDHGTGRTINVQRANITTEEDFRMLQEKGLLSQHAIWSKPGKYMLGNSSSTSPAFAADRVDAKTFLNPVDPYAYLEHAKFKTEDGKPDGKVVRDKNGLAIIENMNDPQLQNALIRCDPRYFGLPLDPSRQPNAPLARANGTFVIESEAAAPGQRQQQQPGARPPAGTKVEF